jgi:hypothetical protein
MDELCSKQHVLLPFINLIIILNAGFIDGSEQQ